MDGCFDKGGTGGIFDEEILIPDFIQYNKQSHRAQDNKTATSTIISMSGQNNRVRQDPSISLDQSEIQLENENKSQDNIQIKIYEGKKLAPY